MKILVMPKPIEGVSREEMLQHAAAEIQAVWELYAQGICREFYTRANDPGREEQPASKQRQITDDVLLGNFFVSINAYVSFPSPFSLSQKEALIAHLLLSRCVSRRLRGKDREKNQRSQPREMRKRSV